MKDGENGVFKEWWNGHDVHFGGEQAKALGEYLARYIETVMKTAQ